MAAKAIELPHLRNSERKSFKRCQTQWDWAYNYGYVSKSPNINLWFGTGWHLVMAHRYGLPGYKRGNKPLGVWREYVKDEMVKIRTNYVGDGDWNEDVFIDAGQLGEHMIGNYLDEYGKDEEKFMIQVERPFLFVVKGPNGQPLVELNGTYDGVYVDEPTNEVWLDEHKTAKSIQLGHLPLDDQGGTYLAVAEKEMHATKKIKPSQQVVGIMYNFARKAKKDDRPVNADGLRTNKPTKDHYIAAINAKLKMSSVTAKISLRELQEIAEAAKITVLGDPSLTQPLPLFHREPVRRTRAAKNRQIKRIAEEATVMADVRAGRLPLLKAPDYSCHRQCAFYQICKLHEEGSDWQDFAKALFDVRDPYSVHRKSAHAEEGND